MFFWSLGTCFYRQKRYKLRINKNSSKTSNMKTKKLNQFEQQRRAEFKRITKKVSQHGVFFILLLVFLFPKIRDTKIDVELFILVTIVWFCVILIWLIKEDKYFNPKKRRKNIVSEFLEINQQANQLHRKIKLISRDGNPILTDKNQWIWEEFAQKYNEDNRDLLFEQTLTEYNELKEKIANLRAESTSARCVDEKSLLTYAFSFKWV